jgi:formamidopyrimidine-DNA glycosylase
MSAGNFFKTTSSLPTLCPVPELPEVEVLVRQLDPLLKRRTVRTVTIRRERVIRPTPSTQLKRKLKNATFSRVSRRAKFLVFDLVQPNGKSFSLLGHLGMTGRMYLQPKTAPLAKHAAVVLDLGDANFIFEDTRYFGRFTLDLSPVQGLGPEPLDPSFCSDQLGPALAKSTRPIKIKLLDQTLVSGIGNIYASEALFHARISPRKPARKLTPEQVTNLCRAIRQVLEQAIAFGSTVPLNFPGGRSSGDRLFYYGAQPSAGNSYEERLLVYDRERQPCLNCSTPIRRIVQAARSTFFCPNCQRR